MSVAKQAKIYLQKSILAKTESERGEFLALYFETLKLINKGI